MPDQYSGFSLYAPFFVKNRNGDSVAAHYLTDGEGNFVMNPNTPGVPCITPLDYNPQSVIAAYSKSWNSAFSRAASLVPSSDDSALSVVLAAARGETYRNLKNDFSTGGPQDLQRSYNGTIGNAFVDAFTDAAALNLGLAAGAGNITGNEAANRWGVAKYI